MKNIFREYPRSSLTGTVLVGVVVLGTAVAAEIGFQNNPVEPIPPGSCESPISETMLYRDAEAGAFELRTGLSEGVLVTGKAVGALGVRAAYRSATNDEDPWHQSEMIRVPATGEFALKFSLGDASTRFGVSIIADPDTRAGKVLCESATGPAIHQTRHENSIHSNGNLPWPTAFNAIPDTLARLNW